MDLLIEGGMLLRPFTMPWKPDGWGRAPGGWTPDRGQWVQDRADQLQEETPALPREFALLAAEKEHGALLFDTKQPWPGWVPVKPRTDRKISNAYRKLFMAMNPEVEGLPEEIRKRKAVVPPDGRYLYRGGKIWPVEEMNEASGSS